MKSELVEELFAATVARLPGQRQEYMAAANYPESVKAAATRLVKAYESKSQLLNEDLLSDIARIDPDFFAGASDEHDLAFQPGDRIKGYTVEAVIGEGGMSVVYRASQSHPIKRRVALKLIRPSLLAPKSVLRFFREQQALAMVGHPNIATLFEVGATDEGFPFAVMEYVNGLSIDVFCNRFKLESRQRILLLMRVCEGLVHAHHHGIIHRDIKPDNILVGIRDRLPAPKLIDFGIAKFDRRHTEPSQTMTQVGQILGSPRYMSPEQLEGKPVDSRSDVYSAALVLFELLSRSPCRTGDTTEEIMKQAKTVHPDRLSRRVRQRFRESAEGFEGEDIESLQRLCARDLDWILEKALMVDPDQRYESMRAFIQDLRAALRGQPLTVSRPGMFETTSRFLKVNGRRLGGLAAVALLLGSLFLFYHWRASTNELSAALQATSVSAQQNAAANDLIMRLLASDMYELTTEQFDLGLIPAYQRQYEEIRESGGPTDNEEKTVYGILAVLYAMSGDFGRADDLMSQVADDRQESELRLVREKICNEYAATAKTKLQSLTGEEHQLERAAQQLTLGRCYIVLDMLDEAERLLESAISVYDSARPGCYESLVARSSLVKVYATAGNRERQLKLLTETHERFNGNQLLLKTSEGQEAFLQIESGLRDLAVTDSRTN